jgi:hypothetical protein
VAVRAREWYLIIDVIRVSSLEETAASATVALRGEVATTDAGQRACAFSFPASFASHAELLLPDITRCPYGVVFGAAPWNAPVTLSQRACTQPVHPLLTSPGPRAPLTLHLDLPRSWLATQQSLKRPNCRPRLSSSWLRSLPTLDCPLEVRRSRIWLACALPCSHSLDSPEHHPCRSFRRSCGHRGHHCSSRRRKDQVTHLATDRTTMTTC